MRAVTDREEARTVCSAAMLSRESENSAKNGEETTAWMDAFMDELVHD